MADIKIEEFVKTINQLILDNHPYIKIVKNTTQLLEGLNELKQMVDMSSIKLTIIEQIQFLMVNQSRNTNQFEGHMLHCVISGFAGSGKTTVAKILCKIWTSLDIIKKSTVAKKIDSLDMLEKVLKKNNDLMQDLNKELTQYYKLVEDIKKNAVSLKKHDDISKIENILKNTRLLRFSIDKLIDKTSLEVEEDNDIIPFIKATREDLVGKYLGSTAPKTKAILDKALGGVLFIDEAYSLYHGSDGSKDSYGEECLSMINEYMSMYPDQLIVIFAGYKDLLLKTIFKVQPGLKRRCGWFFEIENYTAQGLAAIFKLQLEKQGWILQRDIQLDKILLKYKHIIVHPGDIENIVLQTKMAYADYHFKNYLNSHLNLQDSIMTKQMILQAIHKYQDNHVHMDVESKTPPHMYL